MSAIIVINNANCSAAVVKNTKNGNSVMEFGVAVNSVKGDKPVTTWYAVELWNGNLESFLSRYSVDQVKGAGIEISGRLDVETYTSKDGTPGFKLVVKNPTIVGFYPRKEEEVTEELPSDDKYDQAGNLKPDPQSMTTEF